MFALSRLEWLVLAAALLLCPGFTWSIEPEASLFDSAAAGGSAPPKKQE
jgi:hypothetical protein